LTLPQWQKKSRRHRLSQIGKYRGAQASSSGSKGSNGVVVGKSKKKEITYTKTQAWEDYYKSAL
jgi:hypothetical protein